MALSSTCVLEVQTTGSDNNGALFNAAGSSPGTDYTYGAGQVAYSYTDLVIGATNTQLTSVARPFIAADNRNGLQITGGTGFTTGFFEMTAESGVTATMDRATGTAASTGGTGNLGGALATVQAALTNAVKTNLIWIKASGIYVITSALTATKSMTGSDDTPNRVQGYTTTRGDNGLARIQANFASSLNGYNGATTQYIWSNIWFDGNQNVNSAIGANITAQFIEFVNCKFSGWQSDGFKYNPGVNSYPATLLSCEITDCNRSTGTAALNINGSIYVIGCNVHNNSKTGIRVADQAGATTISGCLIANNAGASSDGINYDENISIRACSIYNNGRDGIHGTQIYSARSATILNNLVTNNGGYGNISSGIAYTTTGKIDYNAYYSNTSGALSGISAGAHDVTLTANPFTNAAAGDFSLNSTAGGGAACKAAGIPGAFPGGLSTSYIDIGAVQHQDTPAAGLAGRINSPNTWGWVG